MSAYIKEDDISSQTPRPFSEKMCPRPSTCDALQLTEYCSYFGNRSSQVDRLCLINLFGHIFHTKITFPSCKILVVHL